MPEFAFLRLVERHECPHSLTELSDSRITIAAGMDASDDQQLAKPKSQTLDLIFDLVRAAPDEQLRAADGVDSKIFQGFAAGSVLIGLSSISGVGHGNLTAVFVSAAVAAFLVLAGVAIWALWSRKYRVSIGARQLWDKYWSDDPSEIKHAFVDDIASGYVENEDVLAAKHKALRVTLITLAIEAAAIGAALIVSAL